MKPPEEIFKSVDFNIYECARPDESIPRSPEVRTNKVKNSPRIDHGP